MIGRVIRRSSFLAALAGVASLALAAPAGAHPPYAPLDQPGVRLTVPRAKLRASLECQPQVRDADREPVLLNPATGVTPEQNFSWNWEPALEMLGIPWCAYSAPAHTLNDIQVSGQYLVHAIRRVHALAGRRIAVMGHSQGGMSMRWALRFWPDTRAMVADVIGMAGSNHGTAAETLGCPGQCPAATWQQGSNSKFIEALNSRAETFKGISYTQIYSHTDEVVIPNQDDTGSSSLHTGAGRITNVATQDLCPLDLYEHLSIGTVDPVAYALAVDALTHPGPADPGRVAPSVCAELAMPGVNPANVDQYLQILAGAPGLLAVSTPVNVVAVREWSHEPPLACYVFAACREQRRRHR
jgi:hypothetical protein